MIRIARLPGVFRPRSDTWMLAEAVLDEVVAGRTRVLELCTGSGAVALVAARAGASVTALDVSRRSVATVRLNAAARRLALRVLRGDLFGPVAGERFDVIATNPPYVPSRVEELPARGASRAWEAGLDGRAVLDRICVRAPAQLTPGGVLLVVQSSLAGTEATVAQLRAGGLEVEVTRRERGPLGPLMRARIPVLEARGLLAADEREEELVIVRARAPAALA